MLKKKASNGGWIFACGRSIPHVVCRPQVITKCPKLAWKREEGDKKAFFGGMQFAFAGEGEGNEVDEGESEGVEMDYPRNARRQGERSTSHFHGDLVSSAPLSPPPPPLPALHFPK